MFDNILLNVMSISAAIIAAVVLADCVFNVGRR